MAEWFGGPVLITAGGLHRGPWGKRLLNCEWTPTLCYILLGKWVDVKLNMIQPCP